MRLAVQTRRYCAEGGGACTLALGVNVYTLYIVKRVFRISFNFRKAFMEHVF